LPSRQHGYLDLSERLKHNKVDSISFNDAQKLCFNYLNFIVYTVEIPRVKTLLEKIYKAKYTIEDSVMITMRDGAQVSATIVRNRNSITPQPVVFKFGIYAAQSEVPEARYIAGHGYAAVIADTRGKRLSKQNVEPFVHDADDAYDIIDWISKQSWCNGKIGMYGGSYLGFSQWAAVKKVHPALKTIVPQAAVGIGIDFPGQFGIYSADMLNWFHLAMNNKLTDWAGNGSAARWDSIYQKWYSSGKAFNSLDTIEGRPNSTFQNFLKHPFYDRFWSNMVPYKTEFANINIPVLTITGYYDDDQRGAMYYFDQHHLYNNNPEHYLLIGPYDHYGSQGYPLDPPVILKGYKIDSVAQIKIMDLVFQWFDYILKDSTKPSLVKDKINFEVMGSNQWRHTSSLEKMNNDTITFYLSSVKEGNYYKLLTKSMANNQPVQQEVNFADRSDSLNTNEFYINGEENNIIDSSLKYGNYIAFVSDSLNTPIDINGSFIADLNTIINKRDMDLSVNLYQEMPNGKYFQLSNNIFRCSYIKDFSKRNLLTANKQENISFSNTFFVSRHLEKGSRIILLLGINKNKDWEINYGTGKDVSKETMKDASEPLHIQWMTNGSSVKLPVWR
jgi:putative CocE/NonD family hydrolase